MRLSYNDKHLELFEWADDITALTREGQRQFLLHSVRLLRESYMIHAGLSSISYLWGEEAEFCRKFAPYIGNQNIEFLVGEIERAMLQIQQNGSPRIVFTHFALSVSKVINRLQ
jgi:DNA polymerase-3 subunit delta'